MTRIICVGDIHVADRAPVNASETYTQDIIDMLMWVAELEADINADAVVWAGDVFHHKQPSRTSHALVMRMIDVVQSYKNLYIVVGNHDISNDRLESIYEKQPLGVLYAAGAHELAGWHETLPLFGVPWQWRWTTDPDAAGLAFEDWVAAAHIEGNAFLDKALAVTHAPIFPKGQEPPYDYVPLTTIYQAMGHHGSLYYGHIHDYHGIYDYEGVTFANVGAISRGSLTESNLTRPIKVAVWEDGEFTEVEVPHKPGVEIFKVEEAEAKQEAKIDLDRFLSEVGSSTLDMSSVDSVIEYIKSLDLPPEVKKTVIEILEGT